MISDLSASQDPSGDTLFIMWTRTASKTAQQTSCSGTDMASSASVSAGYLARGIFDSMSAGSFSALPAFLSTTATLSSKKKARHWGHQASTEPSSPPYMLMTVGRHATEPSARPMVFVTRSGMLQSRFAPMASSLRKPDMILRSLRSDAQ